MTFLEKVLGVGIVALALVSTVLLISARGQIHARDKAIEAKVDEAARALGGVKAELATEKSITAHLSEENAQFVAKLKTVDHRVKPTLHAEAVATVADQIPLGPAEHRFSLSPDGHLLSRRQAFRIDAVVVTGVDEESRLGKLTLQELDPDTLQPIASLPVSATHFEFTKEHVVVPFFHPRAVVGITNAAYFVGGAQLLNGEQFGGVWSHLNASVLAGWDSKIKQPFGEVHLGFRPFNWTVSIGPSYRFPTGGWGAAALVELTR